MNRAEMEKRRAALAAKRAKLGNVKKARLQKRIQEAPSDVPASIQPRPKDLPAPLSATQKRLWFLDRLYPGNLAYNMPIALRVRGPFHLEGLTWALHQMMLRHEILRTSYPMENGEPVQKIAPDATPAIEVVHLDEPDTDKREASIRQETSEFTNQPFDLAKLPMIRVLVLIAGEEDHQVVINQHHILSDGWSMGVFSQEMVLLYARWAMAEGAAGQLPAPAPLPIQFADYAFWQQQWIEGPECASQLNWWRDHFADATPVLRLPTDHPRPRVQTHVGHALEAVVATDLTTGLHELAKREDATLFMVMQAAFFVLLYRLTGQTDILTGTHIANRERPEVLPLIGFFANTLPLRGDLRQTNNRPLDFRSFLKRVRDMALGVFAHQDLPFEKIVEALDPPRDPGRPPLFQAFFVLQNAAGKSANHKNFEAVRASGGLQVPGGELTVTQASTGMEAARYELLLAASEQTGQLVITMNCNADLFSKETMARWLSAYQTLLASIIQNPEQAIDDLEMGRLERRTAVSERAAPPNHFAQNIPSATPIQNQLAKFWQEVLGRPVTDAHADFFSMGGNSYDLVKVHYQIEEHLKPVPLARLFLKPTIAGMAAAIAG